MVETRLSGVNAAPSLPEHAGHLGRDESTGAKGLRYYLERALAGGDHRKIRVVAPPEGLFPDDSPRPVVITEALPEDQLKKLRQYVERGGAVLCVLRDVDTARSLARLLGAAGSAGESPSESASEAVVPDYALLAEMDLVVSVDTSATHIASAVGTPVVALFGPGDPRIWRPYGSGNIVVRDESSECLGCKRASCFREAHFCMDGITVERVMAAAGRALRSVRPRG